MMNHFQKIIIQVICMLIPAFIISFSACRKQDNIDDDPAIKLSFSTDSIVFDTVFATVGSVTQYLKVYNTHNKQINISTIRLAGGNNSNYRINIDGSPSIQENDVEIAADDSIFVFIRVTIDPNDITSPFVVTDSIIFITNGNFQDVDLVAWGQNAYYIVANTYKPGLPPYKIVAHENSDTTWDNLKPYLVYGYAVVDSSGSLTIDPGVQIHFHNGSGMWIYRGGKLEVNGEKDQPVIFQGDKLEHYYQDIPGQWDRIWINEGSTDNIIDYAIIRNGFIGIQAEMLNIHDPLERHLLLTNTIIENMSGIGILARWYEITGINNVIANCGSHGIALTWGGNYDFRQCTFANYWNHSVRQAQNLALTNYFVDINNTTYTFDLDAYFGNCINYGNLSEEIILDKHNGASFNYKFENCLLRTELNISDPVFFPGCFKNQEPRFVNYIKNDYHPDSLSPAIDAGNMDVINTSPYPLIIEKDIDENSRMIDPDLGAYEYTGSR